MLSGIEEGRWSRRLALAAVLLVVAACAPQIGNTVDQTSPSPSASPSPSPAPTPTPPAPLQASDSGFAVGEVGVGVSGYGLQASGGVQPYTWTVSGGALPTGLSLASDGSVSGAPSHAGTFAFTIRVTDAAAAVATLSGSVLIKPHLTATLLPPCATECSVELGCVTVCGGFGTVGGGVGPYTYSFLGQLPAGTSLSPTALTLKGTFGGVPGRLQFTAEVTDGLGVTAAVSPTYHLFSHIALSDGKCPYARTAGGPGCITTTPLTFTGGTPGKQPIVKSISWLGYKTCGVTAAPTICPPPTSFAVTYQAGSVSITLTYPNYSSTTGILSLQISDQSVCGQSVTCSANAQLSVG